MVDLDLSEADLRSSGFGGLPEICGNEGDVGDCYYNFSIPELGSWFGVDMPMDFDTLRQHGFASTTFFDDESGTDLPMQPGEVYYPPPAPDTPGEPEHGTPQLKPRADTFDGPPL